LRPALLGVVGVTLVVACILFGFAASQHWVRIEEGASAEAKATVHILEEHAEKTFETEDAVLELLLGRLRGMGWHEIEGSAPLFADLGGSVARRPQARSIVLVDETGRPRFDSRGTGPGNLPGLAGSGLFAAARDGHHGLVIGTAPGWPGLALARRIEDPAGGFAGIAIALLDPRHFDGFYADLTGPTGAAISLIAEDGSIFLRYPRLEGRPAAASELVRQQIHGRDGGVYRGRLGRDDRDRLNSFKKLVGFPVYVVYGIDQGVLVWRWLVGVFLYALFGVPALAAVLYTSIVALRRAQAAERAAAALADANRRLSQETGDRARAEDALRQAQKMEAVGQMTGGVAHDFNNLLTVLAGNLQLIESSAEDPERVRRLAGRALAAVERGERLTHQLLAFARRQLLRPEVIDPNRVIEDFARLMQRAVGEAVLLDLDLAVSLPPCRVDPAQLEAAVLNLVVNARDALDGRGRILIRTATETLATGAFPEVAAGVYVRIDVVDDGPGMPPDVAGRAFEPFFTTKEIGKGSGLGLSQVYGFAKQSAGHVGIDTAPGAGTTVSIYLPRSAAETAASPASAVG
jgi:two-component system NtrC family sensor kinase